MSFFKKLNHLVQSHINDLIDTSRDETSSRARRKFLARHDVGEDLQKDARMLRQRVDDALAYQDNLQAKIDKLYQEIADWDDKANQAVSDGRDTDARFALGRLQQSQRELEIAESALREHKIVAQELISQVNMLEAVLEQAEREKNAPTDNTHNVPVDVEDDEAQDDSIARTITQKLDETRRSLGQLVASRTAPPMSDEMQIVDEVPQPPPHPIDDRKVEDDLALRRARLSAPPKPPKDT